MNRTVLITGTSTGIGRATALYFQKHGWNVAATMRTPGKEKELGKLPNVKIYTLDVTDVKSIKKTVSSAVKDFGRIDVIVNNAGYGAVGPFEAATDEKVRRQFDTNVFGLMNVTRTVLPVLREQGSGIIINISSIGGQMTFPLHSLYHGTKWAVEGFTESLHYELKQFNIKVKLVEPGPVNTDFYTRSLDIISSKKLTAYDEYASRVTRNVNNAAGKAVGPEIVAKKIYRAATDNSARIRYSTGRGAPLILFFRRMLPSRLYYSIIGMFTEK